MHPLARALLGLVGQQALELVKRELQDPHGWEADPRTRTIRRKRPPAEEPTRPSTRAAEPTRTSTRAPAPEPGVIDICPKCGIAVFAHERRGRCG